MFASFLANISPVPVVKGPNSLTQKRVGMQTNTNVLLATPSRDVFASGVRFGCSPVIPPVQRMVQSLADEQISVAWREFGNPKSNNIILALHGYTRNSLDFVPLAQYLAQHQDCRIICPDIVGRGESDYFAHYGVTKYSNFETYVTQTENLLKHLHLNTPPSQLTIIGTSMGGIIGLLMAGQGKLPIHRLILNDIGPDITVDTLNHLADKFADLTNKTFKTPAEVKAFFKAFLKKTGVLEKLDEENLDHIAMSSVWHNNAQKKYILNYAPELTDSLLQNRWFSTFFRPWAEMYLNSTVKAPLWRAWCKIRMPVLIIRGQNSQVLTTNTLSDMLQVANGRATTVTVPGGHAPWLMSLPQKELIEQWLEKTQQTTDIAA
jgi:pimeloyl-ACP methyl ester carboxylesterase